MKKLLFLNLLLLLSQQNYAQKKKCENFFLNIGATSEDNTIRVLNEYGDGFRLCEGANFKLTSNFYSSDQKPDINYTWILPDGSESKGETLSLKKINSKNSGEYKLVAKIGGTCLDTTVIIREIINIDLPKVKLTEGNVCEGSNIQLNFSKTNNYPYDQYDSKSLISFVWTGPNGFSSKEEKPIIKNVKVDGLYKANVTFSGFCVGKYELSTKVLVKKESQVETNYLNACLGGSVTLTAYPTVSGATGKYTWKGPNGFTKEGQEVVIKGLKKENQGAYKVIAKFENGCTNIDSNYVILNLPEPITSISKIEEFCEGSTIILPSETGYYSKYFDETKVKRVYKWTGPDNFESTQNTPTIFNFSKEKQGVYTLNVSFSGECQTSQTLSISIFPVDKPTISLTTYNSTNEYCKGANISIFPQLSNNLFSKSTFHWTGPKNFTSTKSILNIENFDESIAGNYELILETKGCKESVKAEVNLKIATQRKAYINTNDSDNSFCKGSDFEFYAYCDKYSTDDIYTWTGPNGFKSEDKRILVKNLNEKNEGLYTVSVKSNNCPNVTQTTRINIIKYPRISLPDSILICDGGFKEIIPIIFPLNYNKNVYSGGHRSEGNGTISNFEWTGPNNFKTQDQKLSIRNFNSKLEGEYEFKASFSGGCEGSVSKKFKIIKNEPKIDWKIENLCNDKVLFTPIFTNFTENIFENYSIIDSKNSEISNPINFKFSDKFTLNANITGSCNYVSKKNVDITDVKPFKISLPEFIEECERKYFFIYPTINGNWNRIDQNRMSLNSSTDISFYWEKPNNSILSSFSLDLLPLNKSDEGIYKLTGVISGECSKIYEAKTKLIVDSEKPISNFNIFQDEMTLTFENNSTGRISNYLWDFGNFQKSTIPLPEPLKFEKNGLYEIKLDVSNGCGVSTSSKSLKIPETLILGSEIPSSLSNFNIFPNPSNRFITLENIKHKNLKAYISNLNGILVSNFEIYSDETSKTIDLTSLPANTYIIKIMDDKGFIDVKKIVIIK